MRGRCCVVLRLKTRNQFQAVLAGSKLATSPHFAVHQLPPDAASFSAVFAAPEASSEAVVGSLARMWLGAMVPKRWAKRAVTRNAIKRQIYNVARESEYHLPHGAWVVRLRAGFDRSQFRSASSSVLKKAVRAELLDALARAGRHGRPKSLQGLAK